MQHRNTNNILITSEHKHLYTERKGCLKRIYNSLGLFRLKNISEELDEKKLSPYVINSNMIKNGKLLARELLIRANPLYGNKVTQKASKGTCVYYALNYIRTRYKQCVQPFPKERYIEKAFSKCRRKSINVNLCLDRFKWILDYWLRKNKKGPDSSMTTEEWIDLLSREAEDRLIISSPSCSKEKNDYLLSETYKHIFKFIEILKKEKSSPSLSLTVEQLKGFIEEYDDFVKMKIRKNILEQDLKLNFPTLVKNFLEERRIHQYSNNINEFIYSSGSQLNMITERVFFDQEARLNELEFFGRDITHSISALLDVIAKNGPLVFCSSGNFTDPPKTTYIKSVSNYPILDLKLSESKCKQPNHAMVLVGGGIDAMAKEFVYLIDPNDTFTVQSKAPVYRVPFDKFKKTLVPYDSVIIEIDNEPYYLIKNYFVYSKNGLNLTRDPVTIKKIAPNVEDGLHDQRRKNK